MTAGDCWIEELGADTTGWRILLRFLCSLPPAGSTTVLSQDDVRVGVWMALPVELDTDPLEVTGNR